MTGRARGTRWAGAALAAWVCLLGWLPVLAHESQPASLEIRQLSSDRFEVLWRAPVYYSRPHPARLRFPGGWRVEGEPALRQLPDSALQRQLVSTGGRGVDGAVLEFPGLETTITDVFVRLARLDGTTFTAVVRPTDPRVELRGERPWWRSGLEYTALGFHHILLGIDHLLFVLGLLLLVQGRWMLLKTITAFTLAHSLTLGLATLGWAQAPGPPLNAAIALSILFLGPEIVRSWKGQSSLTIRYPWVVAFAFGLLHGFGFASGLSTAGLPRAEIPAALLFFNVGVELGQLAFVFLALLLAQAFRVLEMRWPVWVRRAPGYAVGVCGAYWTIQRAVMLWAAP